jgi:hypothetical protein
MSVPLWCDGGMNTTTSAPANENHHIWNNNGTYWCHFTVHPPDFTKRRVRMSLHTADIEEARRRRDALLATVPMIVGRIPCGRTLLWPDIKREVQRLPACRDGASSAPLRARAQASYPRGARHETRAAAAPLTSGSGRAAGGS